MKRLFEILSSVLDGKVLRNEPMARHTTWRVGGPADLFIVPVHQKDALRTVEVLGAEGVGWMTIGFGSNLLVRDGGIRGAVIHTGRLRALTIDGDTGKASAEAGLPLTRFIRVAAEQGLAGLEDLAGIPGTVGGAVAMNAGAGSQEISKVVRKLRFAGPGGLREKEAEELAWNYRSSGIGGTEMILEVDFQLRHGDPVKLADALRNRTVYRREVQGVGKPNAGSVFKNPSGDRAWRLIDAAGMRGAVRGGARVSTKHANFIVNEDRATAADIASLIKTIRDRVKEVTGVDLEPEIRIAGED